MGTIDRCSTSARAAAALAAAALLLGAGSPACAQRGAPRYYELAIVDLMGRRDVQGRLPLEAYAPRSSPGGAHPLRSPDGAEIYFDCGGRLFAVPVETARGFVFGEPRPLPIEGFVQTPARRQFDPMPGGGRFLLLFPGTN